MNWTALPDRGGVEESRAAFGAVLTVGFWRSLPRDVGRDEAVVFGRRCLCRGVTDVDAADHFRSETRRRSDLSCRERAPIAIFTPHRSTPAAKGRDFVVVGGTTWVLRVGACYNWAVIAAGAASAWSSLGGGDRMDKD